MRLPIYTIIVVSTLLLFAGQTFCQLETPPASPTGKIDQRVGVMDVSVTYSRPGIKGRKIFGDLVPYGEVWRTGANDPTTITFSDPVKLEGHDVPAGTYSLYTIPGKNEWTIIINKKATGDATRDEKEDQVTFTVKPAQTASAIETFTINITDVATNSANLELAWESTAVKFRMEFDVDGKVMAAIKKFSENPNSSMAGMYYQSALYYFTTGKDLNVALEWVNKSVEMNNKPYWVWRLKSQIQAAMKDYKGAIASAEISKSRAKESGNNQFVKINDDAIAEWSRMK